MSGATPLLGKVFGLFVDCDKMVGKDWRDWQTESPGKGRHEMGRVRANAAGPIRT